MYTDQECVLTRPLTGSDSRDRISAGCQGGDSVYHHSSTKDGGEQQPRGQVAEEGKVEPDLDPEIPPDVMDGLSLVPRPPVGPLPVEELALTVDDAIGFGLVGTLQGGGHLLEHQPSGSVTPLIMLGALTSWRG